MSSSRSGLRVATTLPVQVYPVNQRVRRRRSTEMLDGPLIDAPRRRDRVERRDPIAAINERIADVEQKIDTMLMLLLRKEREEARRTSVPIEITPTHMSFRWHQYIPVGQALELAVTVSLYPPTQVRCVAEVVGCSGEAEEEVTGQPSYLVDVKVVAISEADSDKVHRFILRAQRERRRAAPVERRS